jgi:hypothetical protein
MPNGVPRDRLAALAALVDASGDLSVDQWYRLYEHAAASGADLLLEVGRGYGNSTVVLVEAAHELRGRVVSIGDDDPAWWEVSTWPRLRPELGEAWHARLEVLKCDARAFTPPQCRQAFLFWDAHGVELAEDMLGRLIPALPAGSAVVVHDVSVEQPNLPPRYRYSWRGLISQFPELLPIGAWLDENGIAWEQDTEMLAFTLPAN